MNYWVSNRISFLQTLKFRFSYRNRPARHRSNSKPISPTERCKNINSRHISWTAAHQLNIDRSYMACWAERTFRKHHITAATALRVQVRDAHDFRFEFFSAGAVDAKKKRLKDWSSLTLQVTLRFPLIKWLMTEFSLVLDMSVFRSSTGCPRKGLSKPFVCIWINSIGLSCWASFASLPGQI